MTRCMPDAGFFFIGRKSPAGFGGLSIRRKPQDGGGRCPRCERRARTRVRGPEGPLTKCELACKPDSVQVDETRSRKPWATIHLGSALPQTSVRPTRDLVGGPPVSLSGLAPGGVCRAARSPGTLVSSYLTVSPLPVLRRAIGGLLSAALSVGSLRLAVSQHPALWSPDFPRHRERCRGRPASSPPVYRAHGPVPIAARS